MTQKEIDKFLANTKVYVNGNSKDVQEKLFKLGYHWAGQVSNCVIKTSEHFLFISYTKMIISGSNIEYLADNEYKKITAEEILSLELTESYRPFKDIDECWNEMFKHAPFGWCKHKEKQRYDNLACVGNNGIDGESFNDAYKIYTFADGTPFGIKED